MTLLHGWNGPYNNQNAINRGANAGYKVSQLAKNDPNALSNADIQYTTRENGRFSLDGGLAYSMESLGAADQNNDGIVTTQETGFLGQVIDLNNDGRISASENLAYTMYQDAAGNMDGVATAQERAKANDALISDPTTARQQMMKLHQGHNLEQREANMINNIQQQHIPFQELFPPPAPPPPPPPQIMQFMQQFMQMIMQMFSFMMPMNMGIEQTSNYSQY